MTNTTATSGSHDWFTVVTFGSGRPIVGPWHGAEAAEAAMDRWAGREGASAGSFVAAHNMRIVGPFCTRAQAREADICDYLDNVCRCDQ